MKAFTNPVGPGTLWFDNLATAEGTSVGYDPQARRFLPTPPFCANRNIIGCNWIAPAQGAFCRSCAMTVMAPDPDIPNAISNWAVTEAAKRWAIDNFGQWSWFRPEDPGTRPRFHMLADGYTEAGMGHREGLLTISVSEADPVLRETRREALREPYRTMIGHFRHEIAHMLWWRLSLREDFLSAFRERFGDERVDYADALKRHYEVGAVQDWRLFYLTTYASAHPHEDWAETAAHLMHLTDITDTSVSTGLTMPELPRPDWKPYAETDTATLLYVATAVALRINYVNRSMGLADIYPFVLSEAVRHKIAFVHDWLRRGAYGL